MKICFLKPGSFRVNFDRVIHVGEDAVDKKTVFDVPAEAGINIVDAGKAEKAKEGNEGKSDIPDAGSDANSEGNDTVDGDIPADSGGNGDSDAVPDGNPEDLDAVDDAVSDNPESNPDGIKTAGKKKKGLFGNK